MKKRGLLALALGGAFAAAAAGYGFARPAPAAAQDQAPAATGEVYRHPTLGSSSQVPVGIQLLLVSDISGSISSEEYQIELKATGEALNSQLVRSSIKYKMGDKSVAVAFVDFADDAAMRIPWVDIRGSEINDLPYKEDGTGSKAPDKLDALTGEIENLPRRTSGGTAIESATDLAATVFFNCPWRATERRVLDVFGDGRTNEFPTYNPTTNNLVNYSLGLDGSLEASRDRLAAMGTTINGFAIVNEEPDLEQYYRGHLATQKYLEGPDGLHSEPGRVWAVARNMQNFGNTNEALTPFYNDVTKDMKQKISVEVASLRDYKNVVDALGMTAQLPPVPPLVNNVPAGIREPAPPGMPKKPVP